MNYEQTRLETKKHQENVKVFMNKLIKMQINRYETHDISKELSPEVEIFAEYTPKLAKSTFGSEEYKSFLKEMKPALEHHYAVNRHHPEHFPNGIIDMNLVDLIEMICDWKAASLRHNNGNILKSIDFNKDRFNISDDLVKILKNTAELLENQ